MSGIPRQKSGGTNAKPVTDLRLSGTYRADRHADRGLSTVQLPAHAVGTVRVPRPPAGLSPASRRLWKKLHDECDLVSTATRELLVSALRSKDIAERARVELVLEIANSIRVARATTTRS